MSSSLSPIDPERRAGLTRRDVALCVAASAVVFFFHQGPFWRHPWRLDGAIGLSYLVIPVLVAAALARRGRASARAMALGTLEVTCWKFAVTFVIAHTVWMFATPPSRRAAVPAPLLPDAPAVARRRVVPEAAGALEGSVRDASGASLEGTLVFVEAGLDEYVFEAQGLGPGLSIRSGRVEPALSVVELGGEFRARSGDAELHALVASQGEADLFNLPLQSSGAWSTAEVRRGQGIGSLRCTVHPGVERGRLVVVAHPFHAALDAAGRFAWSGVPAVQVRLAAVHPDGREARASVTVGAARATAVVLELSGGEPAR